MKTQDNTPREKLATRLGFILISAGCAIGLGNVWRFPYIVGQNGGGAFVALYLVFLILLGLPVLMMEFAVGRAAQKSIARVHEMLTPEKRLWRLHGIAGAIGNIVLMMFYSTVTGWMLIYFCKSASGAFEGLTPAQVGEAFGATLGSPGQQIAAMLCVVVVSASVCAMGLQKGLERVTKWMMLGLLALIVVLAVNSLLLDGANEGLRFYLVPDFARMKQVGIVKVVVEAMNHAFFTLSLGIGAMAIFGSYIGRSHTLVREAATVGTLDTLVALSAGLVIIPACFAYGIESTQGPGLVFVTLPNVFNSMPGGRFWSSLFFLFMTSAALTTVLSVFECIIACVMDYTSWSRRFASLVTAASLAVLSLPCIFGFNIWSGFQPFGAGSCVLDAEDFIVSTLLLPLGGLAFVVYCCHRCGWGWTRFREEVNAGKGVKLPNGFVRFYCLWILPLVILAVFVIGLLTKFGALKL